MVASSIAVEGTTLTHGTDILVADRPEDVVAAVVRLYSDAALWQRLSAAGFEFVRREYSVASSVPRLRKLLRSIGQVPETAMPRTEVATADQLHQSF
jgi:O-antigen biosynthesis protein